MTTTVLFLSGWSTSGKDAVGQVLAGQGWTRFAFGDALKEAVADTYGISLDSMHTSAGKMQVCADGRTVRQVLIDHGKVMRETLGQDVFAARVAKAIMDSGCSHGVVTDWRLPEEGEALRHLLRDHARRFCTVRVVRRHLDTSPIADARTEHALDDMDFDAVLDNPGDSMEALQHNVQQCLVGLGLFPSSTSTATSTATATATATAIP